MRSTIRIFNQARKTLTSSLVLLALSVSQSIAGGNPPIDSRGQVGLFYTESAHTLDAGRLVVTVNGTAAWDPAYIHQGIILPDTLLGSGDTGAFSPSPFLISVSPSIALGITPILDFSVTLPVYFDNLLLSDTMSPFSMQVGLGDVEGALKLRIPFEVHDSLFEMALLTGVSLPTGSRTAGYFPRHAYYQYRNDSNTLYFSSGVPEAEAKALMTFAFGALNRYTPFSLHLNVGFRYVPNSNLDNQILVDAGLSYRPAPWVNLFGEVSDETALRNLGRLGQTNSDPLRVSPGITLITPAGVFFTVGAHFSFASDSLLTVREAETGTILKLAAEPRWTLAAAIGWSGRMNGGAAADKEENRNPDSDKDGVCDPWVSQEHKEKEYANVCHGIDKCPFAPEDRDGFEDDDGCPDFDNDKDGIPDSIDQCPNLAEDFDGFEDKDGCPDADNDHDGLCDPWVSELHLEAKYANICTGIDRCPDLAEDFDGYQDDDGCPDPDNDLDGIPDSVDQCPNTAGTVAYRGCPPKITPVQQAQAAQLSQPLAAPLPKVPPKLGRGRIVMQGVAFESDKAVLTPESYRILDKLGLSLTANPEYRVEIRGFCYYAGSAAANKALSMKRANAVREYLLSRSVGGDRITVSGLGDSDRGVPTPTEKDLSGIDRIELVRTD